MVEMGPRQMELGKDPRDLKIKNRKRATWYRSRGARLGDPPSGPSGEKIATKEG